MQNKERNIGEKPVVEANGLNQLCEQKNKIWKQTNHSIILTNSKLQTQR